jgi:hypothetical protein
MLINGAVVLLGYYSSGCSLRPFGAYRHLSRYQLPCFGPFFALACLENIAPDSFEKVVGILQTFFRPMVEAQLSGKVFAARWNIATRWMSNL